MKDSALKKNWIILNEEEDKDSIQKIVENRDLGEDLEDFHDPFLFTAMEMACERIEKAILDKERIMVFGDYDVDGISGTAILLHILRLLNAEVSCRLPHRVNDGYGISDKFIDEFKEKEVGLIITTDCGISCFSQIEKANELGIDTIITDHHTIPETPPNAYAIIHPKHDQNYPFDDLTGAGVALKVAHALMLRNIPQAQHAELLDKLLDLATLGTIADLGPLRNENRLLVKRGLKSIKDTSWPGLRNIKRISNIQDEDEIDASTIGFKIAPRINAAGRIGKAYTALDALLKDEISHSQQLEALNCERQDMTQLAMEQVEAKIDPQNLPALIVESSPDWHVGILGLVAGRLAEKYGRPSIILQQLDDTLVASARSHKFFNVVEAITHCKEHLVSFGGHAQAAGFNLKKENYNAFVEAIQSFASEQLEGQDLRPVLEIDCELKPEEISFEFLDQMEVLSPFGIANATPTFLIRNTEPLFVEEVGKDRSHLKFTTADKKAIAFRLGPYAEMLRQHKKVDIVFQINKNIWKGNTSLQLQILDFKPAEE